MVKRKNTEKRKASTLVSPFNSRAVTTNDRLELLEKDIFYWILTDTIGKGYEILFTYTVNN